MPAAGASPQPPLSRLKAALSAALGLHPDAVQALPGAAPQGPDAILKAAGKRFAVAFSDAGSAGPMAAQATRATRAAKALKGRVTPLIAVPYMSPSGKQACEQAGVSWLDFSGNAHLSAPGLLVIIDGRPSRFPKRGRPSSPFAPKSSRVARWLLMHPAQQVSQRQLSEATQVSEGLVSRVATRLEQEHYLTRDDERRLIVPRPQLLLEAWRDAYRLSMHRSIRGHVAARSGSELTRMVAECLSSAGVKHAATGLSAAWQYTRFAGFRTASFFVDAELSEDALTELGFREAERGANLWLLVPKDSGVFQGAAHQDGVRCVHPVQAWLDLQGHPERAPEAAERLRSEWMTY